MENKLNFEIIVVYRDIDNKQVGYGLKIGNKLEPFITVQDIKMYFESAKCINAVLVDNKYIRAKSGYKLTVQVLPVPKPKKNTGTSIRVYTGMGLKDFIEETNINEYNKRDFVTTVVKYFNDSALKKVVGVQGLRGVGKTVGVLQALCELNKYDKSAYVIVKDNTSIEDVESIVNELTNEGIKYICIDEITNAEGFAKRSGTLYDAYAIRGIKIVLSGTDSLALVQAETYGLFHRIKMLNVGFITYQEAKRTMGFTFEEYLKMGGLYEDVRFDDLNGLRRYIDTAVVQNIVNTVKKNVDLRMDIICKLTEDKIRTIVYCVFVSVIFDNLRVNRLVQTKRIVGLFDYKDEKKKQEALDIISSQFGLVVNKHITEDEIKAVKLVLEEIGVLLKVKNYVGKEEKCYVTNQCISNVFFSQVYFLIQEQIGVNLKAEQKDVLFKSIDGEILEAIVMTYI